MRKRKRILKLILVMMLLSSVAERSFASDIYASDNDSVTGGSTNIRTYTSEDGSVYTTTGDLTLEDILEIEKLRTEGTIVYSGNGEDGAEIDFDKVQNEADIYVDEAKVSEGYITFSAGIEKSIMEVSECITITYKAHNAEAMEEQLFWYNAYESRLKLPIGEYEVLSIEAQNYDKELVIEADSHFYIEEGKDTVFVMNIGEKIKEERMFVDPVVVYETSNLSRVGYIVTTVCVILFVCVIVWILVLKKKNNILR